MTYPRFIDLRAVAAQLLDDPVYENLSHAIRSALMAQSCFADLDQSHDCCVALGAFINSPRKRGTLERSSIESSLLANAVMLYARGTSTGASRGERGSIQITAKLTPEQRADHDIIIAIRNRALAHVYVAQQIGGNSWHEDLMFATELDVGGWRPASGSRRVQFDKSTFERLERQLPIARALMREKSQERIEAVTQILNNGPIPMSVFDEHQFDPVERFGSSQAVVQVLGGLISGVATTLTQK